MSQTYKEGHATNVLLTQMKGDPKVNNALDETIKRESAWCRKYSPTCDAQSTVDCAMSSIGLDTVIDQTLALPISCSQSTVAFNVSNIETDQEEIVANNYLSSIQKINLLKPIVKTLIKKDNMVPKICKSYNSGGLCEITSGGE